MHARLAKFYKKVTTHIDTDQREKDCIEKHLLTLYTIIGMQKPVAKDSKHKHAYRNILKRVAFLTIEIELCKQFLAELQELVPPLPKKAPKPNLPTSTHHQIQTLFKNACAKSCELLEKYPDYVVTHTIVTGPVHGQIVDWRNGRSLREFIADGEGRQLHRTFFDYKNTVEDLIQKSVPDSIELSDMSRIKHRQS